MKLLAVVLPLLLIVSFGTAIFAAQRALASDYEAGEDHSEHESSSAAGSHDDGAANDHDDSPDADGGSGTDHGLSNAPDQPGTRSDVKGGWNSNSSTINGSVKRPENQKPFIIFSPMSGDMIQIIGDRIEILHSDGIQEIIDKGRFEMRDNLGRLIVERVVTNGDYDRLINLTK